MELRLAGGAVIDLATREDLAAEMAAIRDVLERPHGRFQRASNGKAPLAANHAFAISLGKPPAGMLWLVQYVLLMGDDPTNTTTIANVRAGVFVGSSGPDSSILNAAQLDAPGCIVPALSVPSLTAVPDKTVVHTNEELYAVFFGTGLSAGASGGYHFNAGLLELPQKAEALLW